MFILKKLLLLLVYILVKSFEPKKKKSYYNLSYIMQFQVKLYLAPLRRYFRESVETSGLTTMQKKLEHSEKTLMCSEDRIKYYTQNSKTHGY